MCDKCIEDYEEQLMTEAIDAVIGDAIKGFIFIAKNVMGGETASTTVGKLECLEAIDDGKPALDMLYGIFSAAGMKQLADKLHDIILIGYECTEIYSSPVLTGNLMDYTAYKITDLGAQTMAFFAVNKADTASFKVAPIAPPATAAGLNAPTIMSWNAPGIAVTFAKITIKEPTI